MFAGILLPVVLALSASLLPAAELSQYRAFHLGMPLADVAKAAGIESPDAKRIISRPQRIEELDWRATRASSEARADSVREILFSFYNGALFEMMVTYDREQTGGLTDADMVEAISGVYGVEAKSTATSMTFNSGYTNTVRVIGQWADGRDLLSLVGFSYGGGFGAIVTDTGNQTLARQAIAESERLDRVEAPQRELDLHAKQVADAQAGNEKSRLLNKPGFRP
jgi:hypothetical protein